MLYSEFLIKPVSAACNLNCEYCYYKDISLRREIKDYGFMSNNTIESIVEKAYFETEKVVTFAFQGGEPLLVGIEFYYQFFEYIKKYNVHQIKTDIIIQTNGTLINNEWAKLFNQHNVLIGVSLDGTEELHNIFRVDYQKNPTYTLVMNAIKILEKYQINFNIITVLNKFVAINIEKIYIFYKNNHFDFIQFIEVLDRNFLQNGQDTFSLNNEDYFKFLKDLFCLWYIDINNGIYISIRTFDVMIHKLLGNDGAIPCFNKGVCQNQNVIEANGDVFSCDFYVTEKYSLGNLVTDSIYSILKSERSIDFIENSLIIPKECRACSYYKLCRNGCRRYRVNGKYYYCEAIYKFYDTYLPKLEQVAKIVKNNK